MRVFDNLPVLNPHFFVTNPSHDAFFVKKLGFILLHYLFKIRVFTIASKPYYNIAVPNKIKNSGAVLQP